MTITIQMTGSVNITPQYPKTGTSIKVNTIFPASSIALDTTGATREPSPCSIFLSTIMT